MECRTLSELGDITCTGDSGFQMENIMGTYIFGCGGMDGL